MRRLGRRGALAALTGTDERLLTLLSEQRVLTQTQLERLLPDVPARTLRYRTERLTWNVPGLMDTLSVRRRALPF